MQKARGLPCIQQYCLSVVEVLPRDSTPWSTEGCFDEIWHYCVGGYAILSGKRIRRKRIWGWRIVRRCGSSTTLPTAVVWQWHLLPERPGFSLLSRLFHLHQCPSILLAKQTCWKDIGLKFAKLNSYGGILPWSGGGRQVAKFMQLAFASLHPFSLLSLQIISRESPSPPRPALT